MKRIFTLFIGFMFSMIFLTQDGLAQVQPDKRSVFDPIKKQLISSARENSELQSINKKLKGQLVNLQLQLRKREKEVNKLEMQEMKKGVFTREQNEIIEEKIIDDEHSNLIREAQEIYLSGKNLNLGVEQKLYEIRLFDLQFEKQELQLELNEKQDIYKEIEGKRQQELEEHEQALAENSEWEKDLSRKVADLEKTSLVYPQEMNRLKRENKALMDEIDRLKRSFSR